MTSTDKYKIDFPAYFSGSLTGHEEKEAEQWINRNEENRKIAQEAYVLYQSMNSLAAIVGVDVESALQKTNSRMRRNSRFTLYKTAAKRLERVAAILFIPLLISAYFIYNRQSSQPVQLLEYKTMPGMIASILLPDSTHVWLNGNSSIKYPSEFAGNERNVAIQGEAFFEVKKDARKRFVVESTNNTRVEVFGTTFNIVAFEQTPVAVTLASGAVDFIYNTPNAKETRIKLNPNNKVIYNQDTNECTHVPNASVATDIAWKEGKVVLRNTSLEDALEVLSRRFNAEFRVKDRALYNLHFTGEFKTQQLSKILDHFMLASSIHYKIIEDDTLSPEKTVIELYK
ncbi:MAG: FecR family protein [Tannerellaceae bacterium]